MLLMFCTQCHLQLSTWTGKVVHSTNFFTQAKQQINDYDPKVQRLLHTHFKPYLLSITKYETYQSVSIIVFLYSPQSEVYTNKVQPFTFYIPKCYPLSTVTFNSPTSIYPVYGTQFSFLSLHFQSSATVNLTLIYMVLFPLTVRYFFTGCHVCYFAAGLNF